MIFKKFSLFKKGDDANEYLEKNHNDFVNDINTGLSRLRITENFENQLFTDISVASESTVTLEHNLKRVPIGRIVLKHSGVGDVEISALQDGVYTENTVELVNNSASDLIVTIIYLK